MIWTRFAQILPIVAGSRGKSLEKVTRTLLRMVSAIEPRYLWHVFSYGVKPMYPKLLSVFTAASTLALAACGGSTTSASFNGFTGTNTIWSSSEISALNDFSENIYDEFSARNVPSSTGNPNVTANYASERTALVRVSDGGATDDTYRASILMAYVAGADVLGGDIYAFERDNGDGSAYSAALDNAPDINTDYIRLGQTSISGGQLTSTNLTGTGYFQNFAGQINVAIVPEAGKTTMLFTLSGNNDGDSVKAIGYAPAQ